MGANLAQAKPYATPGQLAEVLGSKVEAEDVERWLARSGAEGLSRPVITEDVFTRCEKVELVPNEPLRQAWYKAVNDSNEIISRNGDPDINLPGQEIVLDRIIAEWRPAHSPPLPIPERTRPRSWIREQLGLKERRGVLPWLMDYTLAVAMTKALGLDPVKMGV